jgi:hypothetical protein
MNLQKNYELIFARRKLLKSIEQQVRRRVRAAYREKG